jgi:hypothetical protein
MNLSEMNVPLCVYIDSRFENSLKSLLQGKREGLFTKLISIDREYFKRFLPCWNYVEQEKKVLKSYRHRWRTRKRRHEAETWNYEYNLLTHSKIDLLIHTMASLLLPYENFAWIDFAYCRDEHALPKSRDFTPNNLLAHTEKVHMIKLSDVTARDTPERMLRKPKDFLSGGFFWGSRASLLCFQKAYHWALQDLYQRGIADDEQGINQYLYLKQPEIFQLHFNDLSHPSGWFRALTMFNESE